MKREVSQRLNSEIESIDHVLRHQRNNKEAWKELKNCWPNLPLDDSIGYAFVRVVKTDGQLRLTVDYNPTDTDRANSLRQQIGQLLEIPTWDRVIYGGGEEYKPNVKFRAEKSIPYGLGKVLNVIVNIENASLAPNCEITEEKVMREVTIYKTNCGENQENDKVPTIDQLEI